MAAEEPRAPCHHHPALVHVRPPVRCLTSDRCPPRVWSNRRRRRFASHAPGHGRRHSHREETTAEEALRVMAEHQVRRLPVIDGHTLVGIIAQADIARALPNAATGAVVQDVSG
ncbi:MAG TPA: CBS domain-containing protein [Kribbellaceae bacterium]